MSTLTHTAVTGIDDLIALPVGVKLQDRDGDVFTKTDIDTYASILYTFPTNYLIDYLPAVVLPEPVEYLVGDEVRVTADQFIAAKVVSGDLAEVTEVPTKDSRFIWVKFPDGLNLPFDANEIELVRRDIEFARTVSNGVVDKIVGAFRALLDRAPTATKDPNQALPKVEDVLVTSVAELHALPEGSVVSATIPTKQPTRHKDAAGNWRSHGEAGTFNYTTGKLAYAGKLRLVYRPTNRGGIDTRD